MIPSFRSVYHVCTPKQKSVYPVLLVVLCIYTSGGHTRKQLALLGIQCPQFGLALK